MISYLKQWRDNYHIKILIKLGILLVFCIVKNNAAALTQDRVALVIGNAAYSYVEKLKNPTNDANLMASTLENLGFALIGRGAQLNVDRSTFMLLIQQFGDQLDQAKVAVFYFAGHGIQANGSNYLIPVDANPTKTSHLPFQAILLDLVTNRMGPSDKRLNFIMLDACRKNPFEPERGFGVGLASIDAPTGTVISYATRPGRAAKDGPGNNSPYTAALAQTLRRPGLGIFETFNEVGLAVKRATSGNQIPWASLSPIEDDFYFAGPSTNETTTADGIKQQVQKEEEKKRIARVEQHRREDEELYEQNSNKANENVSLEAHQDQELRRSFEKIGFELYREHNLTGGTTLGSEELVHLIPNIYACAERCNARPSCSAFAFESIRSAGSPHRCTLFGGNPDAIPSKNWTSGRKTFKSTIFKRR